MQKETKHTDDARAKMSEARKKAWADGKHVPPAIRMKDQISDLKTRVDDLERWKKGIQEVMGRHRPLIEKGKGKEGPVGEFFVDMIDAIQA